MKTLGFKKILLEAGAYIFAGPEMIGKRTFALELASELAAPADVLIIADELTIDSIRKAKAFLSLSTFGGSYKMVIVDNAHLMTEEAQNGLLKILEEPSATSILILVTSQPHALLSTISSRCRQIFFPPQSREVFYEYLKDKNLSTDQQNFLYQFSNGSIGLLAGDFKKIKAYAEEYTSLSKADINKRFDVAKQLAEDEALKEKVLYWMLYLHTRNLYEPLRALQALYRNIMLPQFNKQLALENFMLQL